MRILLRPVAYFCLVASTFLAGCGGSSSTSGSTSNSGATAPTVSSISPTTAAAGSGPLTVTVTGTGFLSTTTVQVGGVTEATTYVSSTRVTATVTAAQLASGSQLSVIALNGSASSGSGAAVQLEVKNPVPTITQLAPATLVTGTTSQTVAVIGTGFVPATVIDVNNSARTTIYVSATQVDVALTAADVAAIGTLSLTAVNATPGGGTSAATTLAVNNPAPTVSALSPKAVTTGTTTPTTITITGTNFIPASTVQLNGVAVATTYVSATQLTFQLTVAEQATSQLLPVTVMNPTPGGGTSLGAALEILPQTTTPVITQVSPTQFVAGSGDTYIYVNGSGLYTTLSSNGYVLTSSVLWNGTPLTTGLAYDFDSGVQVYAIVPASLLTTAGTASITVSSTTSTPSTSNALTVTIANPPTPTLTSISPSSGPINTATTVTLYGTGFTTNSTVTLNGTNVAAALTGSTELTVTIPATSVQLPGNVYFTVTTPAPGGGTSTSLPYTAYISLANNGMAYNSVNGLLYVSVPSSAGAPYGNSVVSVDPVTGALGTPIPVGSEPDQLAISSDGTTLWVGLSGTSAIREVNLTTGIAGMQFSLSNNSGIYAYPPKAHAIAVLPGYPDSIVVSSALNQYTYEDKLGIYDSGVLRANVIDLSTISTLPAIFVSPTKAEIYATSYESGYQVLSYNSSGVQNLSGNTGTSNFNVQYGTAIQVDSGVAYLDSGMALDAETGTLLGTFYSSGTTVATGPMVSDSSLGKLFVLENTGSSSSATPALIQAFNESKFTPVSSSTLQVNGALSGTEYGAGTSSATELDGSNPINTLVRWGADGLAFRAANGIFSFRTSMVKDLSTVSADLGVTLVLSGSTITGANTIYTATVTNAGPSASTNVALTAVLPSSGVLASVTPSSGVCSTSNGVSCNLGGIADGGKVTVTFVVQQTLTGSSTLSVQVSGSETDPNTANNSATATATVTGSTYNLAPTLSAISPAAIESGSSDSAITVTGTGFSSDSTVYLGTLALATSYTSSTTLTATVPAAQLASLGWAPITVVNSAPGGGTSSPLPLSVFSVVTLSANHILYDPYSQKIMASINSDSSTVTGNSIVAITPETATVGTPVPIGSQPENMALTSNGQILYTILSGSQSVAVFNMLTQTAEFTYAIQPGTGTDTSPAARGIAVQPGTENTVAIDLGSWAGNAIYNFDLTNKTASMVGQASGPYSGSCIAFLDAGDMLAFDTDTSGATLDHYTVTSAGFTYYDYSQYTESTLNGFGCFKLSGGLAFGNAGGVANPATVPATQMGVFPVSGGGEFTTTATFAPDASLQSAFFMVDTQVAAGSGCDLPSSFDGIGTCTYIANTTADGLESFNQNTFMPMGSVYLNMETIEGTATYTGVDVIRWGQDGLAILTSGGHIYLLRGAFVVPEYLNLNSAASLTSSSVTSVTHGAGNTLLTLTGANFVPGVAVTWNGSYRTTTIVDATHVTVAIPASDLVSAGSGSLVATNPGALASSALTVTIN